MKQDDYRLSLRKLIVENYQTQAKTKKIYPKMAYHIQGYMEAGLVSGMASKDSLEEVINQAHIQVFGIPFEERKTLDPSQTDLLDIPTWIWNRKESFRYYLIEKPVSIRPDTCLVYEVL